MELLASWYCGCKKSTRVQGKRDKHSEGRSKLGYYTNHRLGKILWVRVRGKHCVCLYSSYSSLGVHFWSQTAPLFSCFVCSLLGETRSSWTGAQPGIRQNTLSSNTDILQQPVQVPITADVKLQVAVAWGAVFQPFYSPTQHSKLCHQTLQLHLLRALLQSRSCMGPRRNYSPAHKQQGLELSHRCPAPHTLCCGWCSPRHWPHMNTKLSADQ